jgi:hypothetical protein
MILEQISSGGRKDAEGGENEKKTRKLQMLHKSKANTRLVCRECSEELYILMGVICWCGRGGGTERRL